VASKVNQWTLLIGMLPAAFCLSAGRVGVLPLDSRQAHEVLLTAAQSFFALALIINRDFSLAEGALLAGLFITQPFFTSAHSRNLYCAFYFLGGLAALASSSSRRRLAEAVRSALDFRSHR
jgi:cation:H+ antiporter